jgi:phage shock protein C
MQEKKLKRSTNKVIWGICGGLAEYTGLDPMLMRIIWVVATLFTGVPLLIYIALYFIMPAADDMGTAAPGGGAGTS